MSFNGSSNLLGNLWRKVETGPWEKFFAYRPVRVHNKWVWLKTVSRKRITRYGGDTGQYSVWEYGNLFDIVKQ